MYHAKMTNAAIIHAVKAGTVIEQRLGNKNNRADGMTAPNSRKLIDPSRYQAIWAKLE
ncbi:hypothetical protein [Sphingomonas sp.]|uniref:hypothetical protein n=1 Tax=Sphingomonas sp. TaxID=28214 RepID=UPI0012DEA7F6|nr:hypothetical protein [Sphingomonas sp.]